MADDPLPPDDRLTPSGARRLNLDLGDRFSDRHSAGEPEYDANELPEPWREPWPWTRWAVPLGLIAGVPTVAAVAVLLACRGCR